MRKLKTLQDVADVAGVSKMTVSRALRGDKDVSSANVEKVRKAAREIGYHGNHLAASLASKRSDLIGVVVPSLTNIVFPQVMSGVTQALSGTGFQPVLGVTDYDTEKENEIIRSILSWRPAGLIVTGLDQPDFTRKLLTEADIPVVQIMDIDGEAVDACVGFSHTQAGYEMGQALLQLGRRNFGYAGCNVDRDTRAAKRKAGFLKALREDGLELKDKAIAHSLSSVETGRLLVTELIGRQPDLDCIYFSNDDLAIGGASYCAEAGISIPEQIVLAGFNGLDLTHAFPDKIVTSRTSRKEIGETAANLLLDIFRGDTPDSPKTRIIQPTIDLGVLESDQGPSRKSEGEK